MTEIPTITIDMNKRCSRCGAMGAANGGICLKCVTATIVAKGGPMSPINAPIEALEVMARDTFKAPDKAHWSVASAILGRINDEALYSTDFFGKYATAEAYAKDLLELTKTEVNLALKLWRLIQRVAIADFEQWKFVKRARALLLIEVLDAGGDIGTWWQKMQAAATTLDFEMEVRFFLKEQVWTVFSVRVPLELAGVIEEALQRALEANPEIAVKDDDEVRIGETLSIAEMALDKRFRFQALEQVCLHYLQTVEAKQMDLPADPA
jgi:hypothetical protein